MMVVRISGNYFCGLS